MEITIPNPFQEKNFGVIGSFICENGMIGKQPLRIAKTIYPPNWGGPKNSIATEIITMQEEKSIAR